MDNRQRYVCEDCDKNFRDNYDLKLHIAAVHLKTKNFICKVCNQEFSRKANLKRHELLHKSEKPLRKILLALSKGALDFQCRQCLKQFTTKWNLTRHVKNLHNHETYGCDDCGRTFSTKYILHKH